MPTVNRAESSANSHLNDEIGDLLNSGDIEKQLSQTINGLSNSDAQKFLSELKNDGRVPQSIIDNLMEKIDQSQASGSAKQVAAPFRASSKEASSRKTEMAAGGMSQQIALQKKLAEKDSHSLHSLHVGTEKSAGVKGTIQATKSDPTKKDHAVEDAKLYELAGKLVKDVSRSEADGVINTIDQLRKIKGDGTRWQMFIVDNYAELVSLLKPFGAREIEGAGPGMQQARSENIDRALARWEKMKPAEREWARKNPDYYTNFQPKMDEWRAEQEAKRNDTTKVMEQLPDGTVYQGPKKDVHDARENAKNRIILEKIQNIKESGPLSLAGRVAGRAIDKVFDTDFEEGLAALGSLGDAALPAIARARIKAAGQQQSGAKNTSSPRTPKSQSQEHGITKAKNDPWDRPTELESNNSAQNSKPTPRRSDVQPIPKRTTVREDQEILEEQRRVKVSNRKDGKPAQKAPAKSSNEDPETSSTKSKSDSVKVSNTNRTSRPANEIDKEIADLQKEQAKAIETARRHLRDLRGRKGVKGGSLAEQLRSLVDSGDELAGLLLRELEEVQRRLRNLHREKGLLKGDPEHLP